MSSTPRTKLDQQFQEHERRAFPSTPGLDTAVRTDLILFDAHVADVVSAVLQGRPVQESWLSSNPALADRLQAADGPAVYAEYYRGLTSMMDLARQTLQD